MIIKDRLDRPARDRFEAAGIKAEQQLAHYLKRAFGDARDIFVLNDLRVLCNGEVAQIDHLLLHRSGMVIIESKSVTTEISVNRQGDFTRTYKGNRSGIPSPIEQARRQANLLRKLLDIHAEEILPKVVRMLQMRFGAFPIEILVAISDRGMIKHQGARPSELLKADAIPERLHSIVTRHARARGFTGLLRQALADDKRAFDGAGDFNLKSDQVERIARFLMRRHEEPSFQNTKPADPPLTRKPGPRSRSTTGCPKPGETMAVAAGDSKGIYASRDQPACKHCHAGRNALRIDYGKYGYYFRCRRCDKATGIDLICHCRPKQRGRIRKSGPTFQFECPACQVSKVFFENDA